MIKKNIFLLLLTSYRIIIGSDEWIYRPKFGQLIDEVAAVSVLSFDFDQILKNDFSNPLLREKIINKVPGLEQQRARLLYSPETEFKAKLELAMQDKVMPRARIWKDDLSCEKYEQELGTDGKMLKIRPTSDETRGLIRKYWRKSGSEVLYQVPQSVNVSGMGYDPAILRLELEKMTRQIGQAIVETRTPQIKIRDEFKYSGLSRHIFTKCSAPHPFHSGCARKVLIHDLKCPTCRTDVTKKDLKFKPDYTKGEVCAIYLEPILPIISNAVAAASGGAGSETSSKKRARS